MRRQRFDHVHHPGRSGPLHADRMGDPGAPVIVFVHGITGSRRYFRSRVTSFASTHRVIIPDLPGFGLSPKPHLDYTPIFFRDSLRHFLEAEGITGRPHVLVGHSLGAIISVEYAAQWPEDVSRLVLINLPRYDSPEQAHLLFWAGSPNYRKLLGEHSVSQNIAQLRRSGLDLFLRYAARFPMGVFADCRKFTLRSLTSTLTSSLIQYSVDGALERLTPLPVQMIHGARDTVAPVQNVQPLLERYPFMRLEIFPDSGHHVFLTHSRRCLRLIEAFLREESLGGAPTSEGSGRRRTARHPGLPHPEGGR
jgi:pimeloyl-ACP methyl ester carboxylesterase